MSERDRLAFGVGIRGLSARGLADVTAWVADQNSIGQVDLAQVERVQHALLLIGDRPVRLACFARGDNNGTSEGRVTVRLTQLLSERDQFDYAGYPDIVIIDLAAADIWDASTVASLDAVQSKYSARGKEARI